MKRILFAVLLVALLIPAPADAARRKKAASSAAASTHGRLVGQVIDSAGKTVGHARVTIHRARHRRPKMHPHVNGVGNFSASMKPARFVVFASRRGVGHGHASVAVAASGTSSVTVRLHHSTHRIHFLPSVRVLGLSARRTRELTGHSKPTKVKSKIPPNMTGAAAGQGIRFPTQGKH
jgi:hypothetical protein